MTLGIGSIAPDFKAETTEGAIDFQDWIGDHWCLMFSHPKDFTPVCTTELGEMAKLHPEFEGRQCKVIGLSTDPIEDHAKWAVDIEKATGCTPNYPIIGDTDLSVAKLYQMLPKEAGNKAAGRTALENQTVRSVYVIGPDKVIKAIITYPMSTGRNFREILRLIDSVQLTANHKVATPANWKNGDDVIIVPSLSDEEAKKKFPDGWDSPLPYIRMVSQPRK